MPGQLRLSKSECHGKNRQPPRAVEYNEITETYSGNSGKRGIAVKIYDKRKHLLLMYHIETFSNYLRFEITLKCPEKVKQALGTNGVFRITDNMLEKYFKEFISKNVVEPYRKHCEKRDIALRKMLKENYCPASKTWTRDVLLEISDLEITKSVPLMLDIDELIAQLNCIKFGKKQNKYNAKKRFKEICCEHLSAFVQNDGKKYCEIINKLI